jgi:hypothetical protein
MGMTSGTLVLLMDDGNGVSGTAGIGEVRTGDDGANEAVASIG